jgi:hypothetical protein
MLNTEDITFGSYMTSSGAGRIRATSEVNFKSRMVAFVFGEDDRVINPGDLLIEMSESQPGDRQGSNLRKFEITIAGEQVNLLLEQVMRAAELYEQNRNWLKSPATTINEPKPVDENRLAIHLKDVKRAVPRLVG